ncbi:hypothetical protein IC006_2810 [Sulfuracidifex tepidarius]|uniref:Uncharacterized protein n=1 Tax=Sulfuracidifex tepidarius TaxID=1294262 RepID=A0A510E7G0_9CREN|nr:hypothetical protein IC006_2810 [Sulfuracidifex tepidarius]BBG28268.1 hypothetical protein IC007_2824 [Sulfuracidifex tepidarius]
MIKMEKSKESMQIFMDRRCSRLKLFYLLTVKLKNV